MKKFLFSWDTIGIIFTVLGSFIAAQTLSAWMFVIYIVGNLSWSIYWFKKKEFKTMLMCMFFILMNIYGIFKWLL